MHRILATTAIAALLGTPIAAQIEERPLAGPDPTATTIGGAGTIHRARVSELMEAVVWLPQDGPAAQIAQGVVTGPRDDWAEIGPVQELVMAPDGLIVELVVDAAGLADAGQEDGDVSARTIGIPFNEIALVSLVNDEDAEFLVIYTGNLERLEATPEWTWEGADVNAGTLGLQELEGPVIGAPENGAAQVEVGPDGIPRGGDLTAASPDVSFTDDQITGRLDPAQLAMTRPDALIGVDVIGPAGDIIGQVGDLAVDAEGTVGAIVVDVGGFLGLGAHSVALPLGQVEVVEWGARQSIVVRVPFTEDELADMPAHPG